MANRQKIKHTQQDENGTPIYSVQKMCEIVADQKLVTSNGAPVKAKTIKSTVGATLFVEGHRYFKEGLAPENIIRHDSGRVARNESRCTILSFCRALFAADHFKCDVQKVFNHLKGLDRKQLKSGKDSFEFTPSILEEKKTTTASFTRSSGDTGDKLPKTWTEGETKPLPLEFEKEKDYPLSKLFAEQIFDESVNMMNMIRHADGEEADESLIQAGIKNLIALVHANMEGK